MEANPIKCGCGETDERQFYVRMVNGSKAIKSICKLCENKRRWPRQKKRGETYTKYNKAYDHKVSEWRRSGVDQDRWIWRDTRGWDRKHGFEPELTREEIRELIASGCLYCGETNLRMTLDRIDNSKGHCRGNVNPACIRCNYARRAMPYEAWLCLLPGLKEAREKRLFGDWTGRCR